MKLLDKIHSLFVFSVLLLPVFYLVDKHGLEGFVKLVGETFSLL